MIMQLVMGKQMGAPTLVARSNATNDASTKPGCGREIYYRNLANEELFPMGERAFTEIADNLIALAEIRYRFKRDGALMGYSGWLEFVEKNSRLGIRTIQRRLSEINGKDESKANKVAVETVFEELASRLNTLVPSLSDGVEHKTVSLLQQAIGSVTGDLNETDAHHLEEVIYLLETVSKTFSEYAKRLHRAVDRSALTLPPRIPMRHEFWAPTAADNFAEVV
jgi:hypothetical protein